MALPDAGLDLGRADLPAAVLYICYPHRIHGRYRGVCPRQSGRRGPHGLVRQVHRAQIRQAQARRTHRLYTHPRLAGAGHRLHLRHGLDIQVHLHGLFRRYARHGSGYGQDRRNLQFDGKLLGRKRLDHHCRRRELCHHVLRHSRRHRKSKQGHDAGAVRAVSGAGRVYLHARRFVRRI